MGFPNGPMVSTFQILLRTPKGFRKENLLFVDLPKTKTSSNDKELADTTKKFQCLNSKKALKSCKRNPIVCGLDKMNSTEAEACSTITWELLNLWDTETKCLRKLSKLGFFK